MHAGKHGKTTYLHLALMLALSFLAMFALMYAMVDRWENVYPNLNQAYMAALMVAPMAVLELVIMRAMYQDGTWNAVLIAAFTAVFLLCWFAIRAQFAVADQSFIRSMIPHHAGAVLMCERAPIRDAELQQLCAGIIRSQREEIAQMKRIGARLD